MSNIPQPILGNTESEMSVDENVNEFNDRVQKPRNANTRSNNREEHMSTTLHNKIFRSNDAVLIPDFSEVNTVSPMDIKSPTDTQTYHCISTRDTKQNPQVCRPETIDTIIRNLDKRGVEQPGSISEDGNEYVTKARFSTLIGEMRVDILSMINLLNVLNKNITSNNEEMQSVKRDVCRLVDENTQLRERISNMKEESDRRYDTMCKLYDAKIDAIQHKIGLSERFDKNTDQPVFVDGSRSNIRVVRQTRTVQKEEHDVDEDDHTPKYVDSNMDKRATKFKTSQPRTRNATSDVFGSVVETEEPVVINGAFRQNARKDVVETKIKQTTDSKTARANRLGLRGGNVVEQASIKRM